MRETYSTPCRTPHVTKEKRKKERCQWRGSVSRFVDWPAGPRCAEGLQCVKRQRAGRMSASCVPLRERCVRAAHLVCLRASVNIPSQYTWRKRRWFQNLLLNLFLLFTPNTFWPDDLLKTRRSHCYPCYCLSPTFSLRPMVPTVTRSLHHFAQLVSFLAFIFLKKKTFCFCWIGASARSRWQCE